jgi:exosortase/archaeosortase family protein
VSKNRSGDRGPKPMKGPVTPWVRLSPDATLIRVAVVFFVIYAILQTVLSGLVYRGYFTPVMALTARITGACSVATGVPATVTGNDIILSSRILRIDTDCTGVTLMMIYAALVLAYPLSAKRKLLGLAAGIPAILIANFIRLLAVAQLSGPLDDRMFLFVHDYLFKIVMMAFVIMAWALYLASARRHAS